MNILEKINKERVRTEPHPEFRVGDTVEVHVRIKEGRGERTQLFTGTVIARSGCDIQETFTVRRISYGEGVERVFPLNSPNVEKIVVVRRGVVRRANYTTCVVFQAKRRVSKNVVLSNFAKAKMPIKPDILLYEKKAWKSGFSFVAGVDEAGRG